MVTSFQNKFKLTSILLGLFLLLSMQYISLKNINLAPITVPLEESNYTLNSNLLKITSLGNPKVISSFLWSYTLLNSDTVHIKNQSKNSWMFSRFNTISILDDKFYENYLYGGKYLSIIKDDIYGAEIIYSKGLKHYPNDFQLLWNAGFNYYYEIKDYKRAFEVYSKAIKQPEAAIVVTLPFIVSNLANKNNNSDVAMNVLIEHYNRAEGVIKERLYKKIQELKQKKGGP